MSNDYLCKAEKLCKTFDSTVALSNVDIAVKKGEIHGLIGENGSGKSTMSSIFAGIQKADSGTMYLEGKAYSPTDTIDAMNRGVSMVVQEQNTIGKITVAANIFFGKEALFAKAGFLNVKKMNQEAQKALESVGVFHIKPRENIDKLTFEDRKLVELARAFYTTPKLWIVDETSTALTVNGRDILYKLMEKQRESGGSVLFISHDIDEIMRICDSLTILRDGVVTAKLEKKDFSSDTIKTLMIGRDVSGHYYREDSGDESCGDIVLEAENVSTKVLKNISLSLHKGEILGVGGLSDCGMHDLGKVLFGLIKPDSGRVLKGGRLKVRNAAWAVKEGIAYVSKNRDRESLMTICSIKDNICLPSLRDISKHYLITKKSENELAEKWSGNLEVKAGSINEYCNELSGGNKQKVVLAKWLAKGSDIMILDCPTRGIDVGAKASIYHLIEELKKSGKSIVLISEELPELIGMSDRIVTLQDGKISGEFYRTEGLSEAKLIKKMI
ncbi:Ribose import ATP-binding protein RbsA [Caprobacter fermentans]|uniref:Ribose import ATP-binding protein RbsA n=1 Tax=Caproicibacter fermentans TaxID=2576756 RepID=A0A6N8HWT1_9FIRM|nr:sugar ABC transporter ATP-binding protein [Caproicibacter fermentans]MVB10192.1 Ribose import ATP-binding protein RbsA [Caproicibacter fermentans]QNK41781.1 sugar ABC transporter ATP-binding protein [Caproicibacter fermentans]